MIGGTKGPRGSSSAFSTHISRTGQTQCVPEYIVHRNKPAVVDINGKYESSAISAELAAVVVKKAFALDIQLEKEDLYGVDTRHGQAGLIQDPSLPTQASTPPSEKKQKIFDIYGTGIEEPPAIKPPASAGRISGIPVTARHNVLNGVVEQAHYSAVRAVMMTPEIQGDSSTVKVQEFAGLGEEVANDDNIVIYGLSDNEGTTKTISWKFGIDISQGGADRKVTNQFTDPNLSFEVIGPPKQFKFKVGQKIGIVVYRNYSFDFSNDDMWTHNDWNKDELNRAAIMKLFGPDNSVSIYTGEIIRVSKDGKVIEHDINTYKGCSGAIIFLLDKNQDG